MAAMRAAREHLRTPAYENVVEAATLLSGVGCENTGVSIAHGLQAGFGVLPKHFPHGTGVGYCVLVQLIVQNDPASRRSSPSTRRWVCRCAPPTWPFPPSRETSCWKSWWTMCTASAGRDQRALLFRKEHPAGRHQVSGRLRSRARLISGFSRERSCNFIKQPGKAHAFPGVF